MQIKSPHVKSYRSSKVDDTLCLEDPATIRSSAGGRREDKIDLSAVGLTWEQVKAGLGAYGLGRDNTLWTFTSGDQYIDFLLVGVDVSALSESDFIL